MGSSLSEWIAEGMVQITSLFLLPVTLAVAILFVYVLFQLGGFLRELCERRKVRAHLHRLVENASRQSITPEELWRDFLSTGHGLPYRFASQRSVPSFSLARKSLEEIESGVSDILTRCTFLARIGPMLGLTGTLIPLGPALVGLGAGEMRQVTSNLVLAFSTTILGLMIGMLAYGMGITRRTWYHKDLDDLAYILERVYEPDHATRKAIESSCMACNTKTSD